MRTVFSAWERILLPMRWLGITVLTLSWLYWSWCWGWWGQNKLLQYIFQCRCPAVSEEARYAEDVDIVIAACLYPASASKPSPSGRFVTIATQDSKQEWMLYDEYLDALTRLYIKTNPEFLSDDFLAGIIPGHISYIYNRQGQQIAELERITISQGLDSTYTGNLLDYITVTTLSQFRSIGTVYLREGAMIVWKPGLPQGFVVSFGFDTQNLIPELQLYGFSFSTLQSGPSNTIPPKPTYLIGDPSIPSPMMVLEGRIWQPMLVKRLPLDQLAPEAQERVAAKRSAETNNRVWNTIILTLSGILLIAIWMVESIVFTRRLWQAFLRRTVFAK